ncbi:cadmium-translocating P-type ATPase [Candidatus Marsarchaeota archaeon]|nr:cadmium-translocating P-type ATPase [Candidatus Marsarchaeota archaeon]
MANDPICGMYVDEHTHITSYRDDRKYYFCSNSCKVQFEKPERELKILKIAILLSWPIAIFIVLLEYIITIPFSLYIMLALASIVQFYPGLRFYAGVIEAIKNKSANMDTLIAIGTTAAWGYSAFVVFFPNVFPASNVYFDTSTIIIALILTGTYLQRISEMHASGAIEKLVGLRPKIAHKIQNGQITDISIEKIQVGDMMVVKPGEKIPTDSIITEGESSVDESMISGESMPVTKKSGDKVIGGTINTTGSIKIKAQNVGNDTALSQIISIVRDAASSRVPIQRLVDVISSYFVPAVIGIAVFSAIAWFFIGNVAATYAILVFVSVLIIACPCALGIATPAALLVSSGVSARNGILVKNGEALEALNKVNTIVLDKTGTLTKGTPAVIEVIPLYGYSVEEVLLNAAIAELNSEHVLGKAIVSKAKAEGINVEFPEKFRYLQGSGVTAVTKTGVEITVGNRDMFDKTEEAEKSLSASEKQGNTSLIVGVNKKPIGIIALADVIKEDSKNAVEGLKNMGIEVWMVTGDGAIVANAIAKQLGIANFVPEAKPATKLEIIEKFQRQGKVVAMVGDGVNDAPALAKADVGIAIGAGIDIAIETGSIILVKNKVSDVLKAMDISKRTMGKIKQNLFWAFGYNGFLIPVAAGAVVPIFGIGVYNILPMVAALAMAMSSVSVVSNSLLLGRYKTS